MRRRATLPFMLMLGLLCLVGATPSLVAAQDQTKPNFEHVTVTKSDRPSELGRNLQAYSVLFDHGAYVPEQQYPEAMFVKVLTGQIALRVLGDVVVDSQGNDITILQASPAIPIGTPPTSAHDFIPHGAIANANCAGIPPSGPVSSPPTTPTTTLCLINPAVIQAQAQPKLEQADGFVLLTPGFTVYLPADSQCFFCNITGNTGGDPSSNNKADQAQLLVWAPTGNFSWYNDAGTPIASPSASTDGLHGAVGWTVLRNPGSPCH